MDSPMSVSRSECNHCHIMRKRKAVEELLGPMQKIPNTPVDPNSDDFIRQLSDEKNVVFSTSLKQSTVRCIEDARKFCSPLVVPGVTCVSSCCVCFACVLVGVFFAAAAAATATATACR